MRPVCEVSWDGWRGCWWRDGWWRESGPVWRASSPRVPPSAAPPPSPDPPGSPAPRLSVFNPTDGREGDATKYSFSMQLGHILNKLIQHNRLESCTETI